VADGADALVVVTEWDEFRGIDLGEMAARMRGNVLVDLRNVYDPTDAARAGLAYRGVGRGTYLPLPTP
jgi:UDPglucose 6-dehydrogenase